MPERSAAKATNVSYICTSTVSHRLTHSQLSCLGFALFKDYVRLGFVYSILNLISYQPVSSYWLRWVIGHLFVNSGNVQFKVVIIIIWDIPPWLSTSLRAPLCICYFVLLNKLVMSATLILESFLFYLPLNLKKHLCQILSFSMFLPFLKSEPPLPFYIYDSISERAALS